MVDGQERLAKLRLERECGYSSLSWTWFCIDVGDGLWTGRAASEVHVHAQKKRDPGDKSRMDHAGKSTPTNNDTNTPDSIPIRKMPRPDAQSPALQGHAV